MLLLFATIINFSVKAQQLIFKTYTVEDGLVANPVRKIYQDLKGFIWIGTREGLSKYEGHRFTNYSTVNGLSHNMINDLYESAEGKMYVAENNGTVDVLQQNAVIEKAAFHNVVINQFSVLQNKKVIAATDTGGVYEIKNGNLVKPGQSLAGSSYNDLVDMNDSLLIGGAEGTIRILDKQFRLFYEIEEPKELLTFKFFKDSRGRLWVCTNNGLKIVSAFQRGNKTVFDLRAAPFDIQALQNYIVNDMLEDASQNFWIATINGLIKIDPDGAWQQFSERDGLPSADITCLYQDAEKNIWIGTSLGLVKLVTKNDVRIYTMQNGLGSRGATFLQSINNNLLLISTEIGLQSYDLQNRLFSRVSSGNFFYYGLVQNSRPQLVFDYNNKLGKYDPANRQIVDYNLQGIPNSEVYCSTMDQNGIVFSGTQKGLIIYYGKRSRYEKKFPYRITSLLIDKKGCLWAGTWDNGLYCISYHLENSLTGDSISVSVKDISHLLPDKNIRCLFEDSKGNIWIGTRNYGVVQLISTGAVKEPFKNRQFDNRQGLMSNFVRAIAEDKKGSIWIGSDLGIDKLIPEGNAFRVFNFSRVNNYFATINAILPFTDRSLWFTTSNGLVNIIDGEIENTASPLLYITSVDLGDTSFNYKTYHSGEKVELNYDHNQARFEFSSPSFINEKQIFYSYRLLGSTDTSWSKPSNLHTVSYASLRPGKYRFEVRTIGWDERWGLPVVFDFNVRPAYWQTWWFYLMIGILVIGLLYALYLYRIRQLLKFQKIRNRIATDLHDDIGSTLTNINMLSEISRKNLEQPKEAEKYLQRITEEVTASSQALNDIIWNVNSKNDSMEETLYRVRRYAAELFDSSNTVCHMSIEETMAARKINMEQRRDVYLVYKECMNNIRKHANASNVWVDMQLQNEKLYLKIKDDGKGFGPSVVADRNGLRNIRFRTEKWKGRISIETSPGQGVLIEVVLPVLG